MTFTDDGGLIHLFPAIFVPAPCYLLRTGIKNIAPDALIWLIQGVTDSAGG
jgi:hypothetical protein